MHWVVKEECAPADEGETESEIQIWNNQLDEWP
jgi:hypothetical protein